MFLEDLSKGGMEKFLICSHKIKVLLVLCCFVPFPRHVPDIDVAIFLVRHGFLDIFP